MATKKKPAKVKRVPKPAKKAAKKAAPKKAAPKKKVAKAKKAAPKAKKAAPKAKAKKPAPKPKNAVAAPKPVELPEREPPAVVHRVEVDEPKEIAPAAEAFKLERIDGDDVGEELAEDFVRTATGGDEAMEERDQVVDEESGGPYIETTGKVEFGKGPDASNPPDAEVAPLPKVVSDDEEEEEALDEESE